MKTVGIQVMKSLPQCQRWIVTSSDEDVDVAFLLLDKELDKTSMVAAIDEIQDDYVGPYEVIEELMQPKVDSHEKQELMDRMVSTGLSVMEKEKYLQMLSKFPNLFITSYEEV